MWLSGVLCVEWAGVDRSYGDCSRGLCRGGSRPLWQPSLLQAIQGPAIAATALDSNSTAPRIVAITTTTTPANADRQNVI